ncbi:hypothetical protein DPMN_017473 [Dreissena polymorpha]|uniref:Uncharacterized protein n=1 Tax=Dreissena polymorpha TaxID=45954 RepID=A0A9D4S6E6_DREPO|nr:hypothetical protein DPMN_017473 [Dreissena polymorpha]
MIQLLTKSGEDRMKFLGQTDRPTDRPSNKFAHLRGETSVLSEFHENWAKNVTSTVFTCFHYMYIHIEKKNHWWPYINKTNVLTNFHDDWAKIVTSRVFTRENCHYIHIEKNAPPTGGHVFSPISTVSELVHDIN